VIHPHDLWLGPIALWPDPASWMTLASLLIGMLTDGADRISFTVVSLLRGHALDVAVALISSVPFHKALQPLHLGIVVTDTRPVGAHGCSVIGVQHCGGTRADPLITADAIMEMPGQLAALPFMHLFAKDVPAPHIQRHMKVVGLTPHRPGQQGDIPGQHLMVARCLQHGWLSWHPRRRLLTR